MLKIYLDNCSYNRPFDDKEQLTIRMGAVNAERFIHCLKNENFDYTEWQRDLWKGKTIEEIHNAASEFYATTHG